MSAATVAYMPTQPRGREGGNALSHGLQELQARLARLAELAGDSLQAGDALVTIDGTHAQKMIQAVLEGCGVPAGGELNTTWAGELGLLRARQGVPEEEVRRAWHVVGQVLFTAAGESGAGRELGAAVWRAVGAQCSAAVAGHRAWARELSAPGAEAGRLLDALLGGDADWDAASAAAHASGLPEHGRYLVLVQRPTDWSAPPLGRADLPARLAGARVTWRPHGACAIGVAVLGDVPAARVSAALPPTPGRRTGISLVVDGLAELGRARRLAELAARTVTGRGGVACLAERLPAALLAARPDLARELSTRVLGPVLALDKVSRDVLLDTLAAWLAADGSALRAASSLYCHRNTVLNRIRRVERLTKRSLDKPHDILEISLSMLAVDLSA